LQAARARACGNLGNAFSALSDYTQALQYYNQSLTIAKEARNRAGEGQVETTAVLDFCCCDVHLSVICSVDKR
jgi:tetratricopeptide (TPR) repeat protein